MIVPIYFILLSVDSSSWFLMFYEHSTISSDSRKWNRAWVVPFYAIIFDILYKIANLKYALIRICKWMKSTKVWKYSIYVFRS